MTQALEDWTRAFYLKSGVRSPANLIRQVSQRTHKSASELPDRTLVQCLASYLSNLRTYVQRISSDPHLRAHNLGNFSDFAPLYLLTMPEIWTDKLRNDICNAFNRDIANEKLIVIAKPVAAIFYAAAKKKIELQDEDCVIVCDVSGLVVWVQR